MFGLVAMVVAANVAAQDSDALYRRAMRCAVVATTMATTNIEDQRNETVSAENRAVAEELFQKYWTVVRFIALTQGNTPEQAKSEWRAASQAHAATFFAPEFKSQSDLAEHYNAVVNEMNDCANGI